MAKAAHTPGPWKVDRWRDQGGQRGVSIVGANGANLASMVGQLDDSEIANARLIAATPDLLAACEAALGDVDMDPGNRWLEPKTVKQLRAALQKAKP